MLQPLCASETSRVFVCVALQNVVPVHMVDPVDEYFLPSEKMINVLRDRCRRLDAFGRS